ncbi:MAG: PDZ domain-containing protein [Bdellovibrionota bacterium]
MSANGKPLQNSADLDQLISGLKTPGSNLKLKIKRTGKVKTFTYSVR